MCKVQDKVSEKKRISDCTLASDTMKSV